MNILNRRADLNLMLFPRISEQDRRATWMKLDGELNELVYGDIGDWGKGEE